MIYIFAIPGTTLRQAVFASSEEVANWRIDRSVWVLESILPPSQFKVTYVVKDKFIQEPILN